MFSPKKIVLIVHYFPPINSSGGKRMEAMAKYFARLGHQVTVISTKKGKIDGAFTERTPAGVRLIELNWLGRSSVTPLVSHSSGVTSFGPPEKGLFRSIKNKVMQVLGQIPDPRIPFGISFAYPWLASEARAALTEANVVIGTTPPWPPLLAALIAKWRFGVPAILDYRDQLSMCHEMPGGRLAKFLELLLDKWLTRNANQVVAISEPMAHYYSAFSRDVKCIMNGFDPEQLDAAKVCQPWRPRRPDQPLIVRYTGIVTPGRIPYSLLKALDEVADEDHHLKDRVRFEIVGECKILKEFITEKHPSILPLFVFLPRVPYAEALKLIVSADYLLFCENRIESRIGHEASASGILTTKLFEYLASGRPLLAEIDKNTLAGSFICKSDPNHHVSTEVMYFRELFRSEEFYLPRVMPKSEFAYSLSREAQARQYLSTIIDISR